MTVERHPQPVWDEHWQGYELATDATHRYLWLWQGFNIRLIAVPRDESGWGGYDHGWCYPRDPQAVADAMASWDPDTQDERLDPNRPRCVHGCYLHLGCRTVGCPETIGADR